MQWLAELCVKRPVFATVLSIVIVVVGGVFYGQLGVDQFPKIDFPAVLVPDAHLEVGDVRRFEQDQLVAADAEVPVGQRLSQRRSHGNRLLAAVEHDEIVSKPVHLMELPRHALRIRERRQLSP